MKLLVILEYFLYKIYYSSNIIILILLYNKLASKLIILNIYFN